MNKLLFLAILAVLSTSCNRKMGAIFSKKEKLEIINPEFDYLTAKAKFKFDNGGKKIAATANFRVKKDSIIWISITPGLGIEVARVFIDTENVKVLDKLNKQYYEYTFAELSDKLSFDFNFTMIQSVILGNLIKPYQRQKVNKSEDYYTFEDEEGIYLFQNFIGMRSMKLEKVVVVDDASKNSISVNYGDFVMVNDQIFPNDILAVIDYETNEKPNTEINISYSRMAIENNPLNFPYSVPGKYERK